MAASGQWFGRLGPVPGEGLPGARAGRTFDVDETFVMQ